MRLNCYMNICIFNYTFFLKDLSPKTAKYDIALWNPCVICLKCSIIARTQRPYNVPTTFA